MKPDKGLAMLGLAAKAGKLVSGAFATEKAIKSRKACLVVIAADASDRTKKDFRDACNYYQVPLTVYGTKETLGHSIGKAARTSLAVLDPGLGKAIEKKMTDAE